MLELEEVRTAIEEGEILRYVGRVTRVIGMLVAGDPTDDQTPEKIKPLSKFLSQSRVKSVNMESPSEALKKGLEAPG